MEGCIPIHLIRCLRKYDRGQIGWDRFAAHRIHCFNITNPYRGFRSCVAGPTTTLFRHGCDLSHFVPGPFFPPLVLGLAIFRGPESAALLQIGGPDPDSARLEDCETLGYCLSVWLPRRHCGNYCSATVQSKHATLMPFSRALFCGLLGQFNYTACTL